MTDELITELARLPSLRVVSRTSVMQDKDTHKPLRQIARELDVDAIVEGSIVRSGDKVRITAQLIDARNDRHLWAQSFEGRVSDILSLQDSVARDIAAQAKVALMPGAQFESGVIKSIDPAAHDAYMRGRFFLNKREAEKSTAYFREALTIDPKYAAAYAGLASALESESTLEMVKPEDAMPKATEAARRALELDPKSGEAYTALGSIETIYEWNWEAAEQDLKRGIEFSPNDSLGEMHYSAFLDAMNRPEEAVMHMRRALVLDPLSFFMTRHLGSALFLARHYDEALFYLRRAEEMEPNHFGVVENWISWIYEKKGMQSEAVNHDLATLRGTAVDADRDKLLAIFEHSGWKAYWRARIAEDSFSSQSCAPYFVGASYLRLGERDRAFEWLNRAVDRKCLWVMWAKVDPLLDDARTDARYRALLNRVHLSE
jgi:tetratricopeptide (TPR) repeat protein